MLRVSTPAGQVTLRGDRSHVVGRGHDSDVVVADRRVSRKHVLLEPGADEWLARDTSANGMWRDGRKVSTVPIGGGGVVRLRLGAADGPEVLMAVERPAGAPPSGPALDEAATVLAPGRGGGARPVTPAPAGTARASAPATSDTPSADAGGTGSPSVAMRLLQAIPTLLWLAATGFALGALIALS
jgi:hypothetical protein